jgi:tetratricopeptide (TPR) repeat protein
LDKGILLKQTTLAEAYEPLASVSPTMGYGLGWIILFDSTKGKVVCHHGGGIGIEAMFVRSIEKNQTVILFDNVKNPAFDKAMNALKILNGEKVALPKKSIARLYGKTMVKQGIPAARKLLENIKKDTLNYYLNVDEMNLLGYQFLWNNRDSLSHEVLKANLDFFPSNWNSYDSYGEILLKMGKKEEAIQMYRKSIELNPKNEAGKKIIEQILGAKKD